MLRIGAERDELVAHGHAEGNAILGAMRRVAVLDGRLDETDRAGRGLVAAFHRRDQSGLDVVADHARCTSEANKR